MCVAELNVSTLACQHRWYHLLRPCAPSTNLGNCPSKLGLEGWEIKCDFCPFCSAWNIDAGEYRLLGNDRNPSVGGLSRTPSLSASLASARRDSRRSSLARTDSSSSVSMMMTTSEKNRALNARLDAYLAHLPEHIAQTDGPAAEDRPPSTPASTTASSASIDAVPATGKAGGGASSGRLGKKWRRSKAFGKNLFK